MGDTSILTTVTNKETTMTNKDTTEGGTERGTEIGTEHNGTELDPEPEPEPEPEPPRIREQDLEPDEDFKDVEITDNVDPVNISFNQIVKNVWRFLSEYTPERHVPELSQTTNWSKELVSVILEKALEAIQPEPLILQLTGEINVLGPLFGQGDSLVAVMSMIGMPPEKQYLFLGCYMGQGCAPLETFLMILALKVMFPKRMWLLRGHLEQRCILKQQDVSGMFEDCNIEPVDIPGFIKLIERIYAELPIAAILPENIWVVPGGPGTHMHFHDQMPKLKDLTKANRNNRPMKENVVMFETLWSYMRHDKDKKDRIAPDPMPCFEEKQISSFMRHNEIKILLRGRQIVADGVLEHPKGVFTISSAQNYLDQFGNLAGAMTVKGKKMWIHRIRMAEPVPLTCDYAKVGIGRNVVYNQ